MDSRPRPGLVIFQRYPRSRSANRKLLSFLSVILTNDLRYDSKDSRDMVNASFSLSTFLCAEDWVE